MCLQQLKNVLLLYSVLIVDCSEMTDQVYMEVIVGEEEAPAITEAQLEDTPVNKSFVPAAWATAYGPLLFLLQTEIKITLN